MVVSGFSRTLSAAGLARAQAPTGTITGIVTDSSGGRVGGARVNLTNSDTGQAWALTTSPDGSCIGPRAVQLGARINF